MSGRTPIKRWIYVSLTLAALFGAVRLYYHLTDDFRLSNITYSLPIEAGWSSLELSPSDQQALYSIFNQKFFYMGKGAQCYAFASEDEQYVLKFFKFKHLKPNFLVDMLPSVPPFRGFKQRYQERKRRKLLGVFQGYDLAYRENRQEAKLLYLHLLPTENLRQQVTVVDKMGWERVINLDEVIFILQRKGETLRQRLQKLLSQEQLQDAERAIACILSMYIDEYHKGVYDRDHGVMQNTGFIDDQPFHLDSGKFSKEEKMRELEFYKKDLAHIIWKIDHWVKMSYPQYYQTLSLWLALEYQRWTGESFDTIDPTCFHRRRKDF